MKHDPVLWYCWRCEQATYWRNRRCQRCLQVRQAKIRNYLLAAVCILAFVAVVLVRYWGYR